MTIKVLRNSNSAIHNTTTVYGTVEYSGYETVQDNAIADAIFKRVRPSPLTPTPFEVVERLENSSIYKFGNPNGIYWVGSIRHANSGFGESPTRNTISADGLFNLNRARHKITGRDQDLGESLVELDQTIDLVKKNLERLGKIGQALKDGNWGKLDSLIGGRTPDSVKKQKPSKRLASGYLEIMFGVLPLMSSAHTAVEAYGKGILSRGSRVSAVSGQKRADLTQAQNQQSLSNTGRATFSGTVKNANIATLNSYGLINPVMMAWQRVPYSFVIDWFVPIGTILGSLTAEAGLENINQTYTDIVYQEDVLSFGFIQRNIRYNRRIPGALPPIGNPFGRSAQLSLGKLISSVALIRQRFP